MKNLHMHHVLFDHETSMGISPPKYHLAEMMLDQLQFCLELLLILLALRTVWHGTARL